MQTAMQQAMQAAQAAQRLKSHRAAPTGAGRVESPGGMTGCKVVVYVAAGLAGCDAWCSSPGPVRSAMLICPAPLACRKVVSAPRASCPWRRPVMWGAVVFVCECGGEVYFQRRLDSRRSPPPRHRHGRPASIQPHIYTHAHIHVHTYIHSTHHYLEPLEGPRRAQALRVSPRTAKKHSRRRPLHLLH